MQNNKMKEAYLISSRHTFYLLNTLLKGREKEEWKLWEDEEWNLAANG
jgi:hypothetical protein